MVVGGVQTAHIILAGLRYHKPSLPELFVHYFCLPNDKFIPLQPTEFHCLLELKKKSVV